MKVKTMVNLMPVIMLLLGIVLPTIKAGLTPTAYTTSGGGFKTMTNSMGIIRAWDESSILTQNTTHSGCVSGGCWFQFQFSYSKDFYESALGLNGDSVTEFVSKWGKLYEKAMTKAIEKEKPEKFEASTAHEVCSFLDENTTSDYYSKLVEDFYNFVATNYFSYNKAMLSSYITNYNTSLFSVEREGFSNSVIVAGVTLASNVYVNNATEEASLSGQPTNVTLLPISFVAKDGQTGEWQYTAAESPLEVSIGEGNTKQSVLLESLPAPLINVVASAASAAYGAYGSPTLSRKIASNMLDMNIRFQNLDPGKQKALKSKIDECLPLQSQGASPPTEGNVPSTVSPWSPYYRYMDGAYTDNSAIAHTIASMQQSCIEDPLKYDCTKGLRFSSIGQNNAEDIVNSIVSGREVVMSLTLAIPRLFANCNCGNSSPILVAGTSIDPQLFAEEFPSDLNGTGWELYSNKTYTFDNNTEPSLSYAWRGNVTTISNTAYGISAGMNVDLILIFPAVPPSYPPVTDITWFFFNKHAVVAEEQYKSTHSLFKKWKLPEQWGDALPPPDLTVAPTRSKSSKKQIRPKKQKSQKKN